MKQRVVVQAIIQSHDETLFLRRSEGRSEIVGKYELPGGTLEEGEQPDDGMRRHLRDDLGLEAQSFHLQDVMSMSNPEEGDIQHVFIVYVVDGINPTSRMTPGHNYDRYEWIKTSEIQQNQLRDSALYLLGINLSQVPLKETDEVLINNDVHKATSSSHIMLYSDGGSRGNPGPSAAAFVMIDGGTVIDQGGEYLGITTNNQAEYHGVRLGLERARSRGIESLEFRIDSMLVVNQLNGLYKIKNRELWPINERIETLIGQFEKVVFRHIPREQNTLADALVNKILNEHQDDAT